MFLMKFTFQLFVKIDIDSVFIRLNSYKKIHKRARWILKQIDYFRQFTPKTPKRLYISGETHLYLGKQYRLKVIQGQKNSVKLSRGVFQVSCQYEIKPELVKKTHEKMVFRKGKYSIFQKF